MPARQRHDACETPSEHLRKAVPKAGEKRLPARQRWTRARHRLGTRGEHCQSYMEREGACGLHRQNEIHAGVDSIVSKNLVDNRVATPRNMRAAPLADAQMAAPERVRVAPPGSIIWTSAGSTARNRPLDEYG